MLNVIPINKLDNIEAIIKRHSGNDGNNGGEPPMELIERIAKIEAKLDSVLPTLATNADMHKEFNIQTWRIVGGILAAAGIILAGLKILH